MNAAMRVSRHSIHHFGNFLFAERHRWHTRRTTLDATTTTAECENQWQLNFLHRKCMLSPWEWTYGLLRSVVLYFFYGSYLFDFCLYWRWLHWFFPSRENRTKSNSYHSIPLGLDICHLNKSILCNWLIAPKRTTIISRRNPLKFNHSFEINA